MMSAMMGDQMATNAAMVYTMSPPRTDRVSRRMESRLNSGLTRYTGFNIEFHNKLNPTLFNTDEAQKTTTAGWRASLRRYSASSAVGKGMMITVNKRNPFANIIERETLSIILNIL